MGYSGAADAGIALATVLDVAEPDETILVLSAVDGCDAMLLRTTDQLASSRQVTPVSVQRAEGIVVPHLTYLSWHGLVDARTAAPTRAGPARRAAGRARRGVEVRLRRNTLP